MFIHFYLFLSENEKLFFCLKIFSYSFKINFISKKFNFELNLQQIKWKFDNNDSNYFCLEEISKVLKFQFHF